VSIESKVCEFKNQEVEVLSYDSDFNPVEAHIGFKCLNSVCDIGDTKIRLDKAVLKGKFPQTREEEKNGATILIGYFVIFPLI